ECTDRSVNAPSTLIGLLLSRDRPQLLESRVLLEHSSVRENPMEPIVLALSSNERYFPGLYCAVASALSHLDATREVNLKVLDGGISRPSTETLSRLVGRVSKSVRLEFVTVDPSIFSKATLGPGESHMTYCRILLPHL